MSSSSCCFLTCLLTGQVVWYSHFFKNFPQFVVIHTVKVFGIVTKAEVDVFLELSCFFYAPTYVGNLISRSSSFSKSSLKIWMFTVHVLLKPGLENFDHYFSSVWSECVCAVVCLLLLLYCLVQFRCVWEQVRISKPSQNKKKSIEYISAEFHNLEGAKEMVWVLNRNKV